MRALILALLAGCATTSGSAHRAHIDGVSMYYEEYGSGRPLVLLHGGGSTVQTSFGAIIPALARTHHVIAPEQQAHGHTPDIDRPLTFAQMADDTAALLEQLHLSDADVIGFSNGGVVAMELAIRHPRLVHRLVICSSYYAHAGLPDALWRGMEHASMNDMPAALRSAFEAATPDAAMRQRMFERQVRLMREFVDLPEASLRAIEVPALVMVADHDVMPVEHAASLAHLLPHADLAVLPHSAHGTYLGAIDATSPGGPPPAIAVELIERFLTW